MKIYLDYDEFYPWMEVSTTEGHFSHEVEISEEEYALLMRDLEAGISAQRRLKKLHPHFKNDE